MAQFYHKSAAILFGAVSACTATEVPAQRANELPFELIVSLAELPRQMEATEALASVRAAAKVWTASCSGLHIRVEPLQEVGRRDEDRQRIISFRRHSWCPNGERQSKSCYPEDALAMTSTYSAKPRLSDGAFESDIEVNSVLPTWSRLGGAGTHSLVSVLAHEIGHALGFEHPCDDGTLLKPIKPPCRALSNHERQAVMFPAPGRGLQAGTLPLPRLSKEELAELCRRFPVEAKDLPLHQQ